MACLTFRILLNCLRNMTIDNLCTGCAHDEQRGMSKTTGCAHCAQLTSFLVDIPISFAIFFLFSFCVLDLNSLSAECRGL